MPLNKTPALLNVVLMTSRSGSSLVCKILAAHGLSWSWKGDNPIQHGDGVTTASYLTYEHQGWKNTLKCTCPSGKWPLGFLVPVNDDRLTLMLNYWRSGRDAQVDFVKSGVEFAGLWMALGDELGMDIKFIKVRRPVEQVAASLARRRLGDALLGAEVAERRFRLMDNIEGPDVHTDVLTHSGMWRRSGIREALIQCGVDPRHDLIRQQINPAIFHN